MINCVIGNSQDATNGPHAKRACRGGSSAEYLRVADSVFAT